jgi:hypothetical protein
MTVLKNIGSARRPINLGRKFIEATDAELRFELEKRGLTVLYPAHECVDRPNLPCPACERVTLRTIELKSCG